MVFGCFRDILEFFLTISKFLVLITFFNFNFFSELFYLRPTHMPFWFLQFLFFGVFGKCWIFEILKKTFLIFITIIVVCFLYFFILGLCTWLLIFLLFVGVLVYFLVYFIFLKMSFLIFFNSIYSFFTFLFEASLYNLLCCAYTKTVVSSTCMLWFGLNFCL